MSCAIEKYAQSVTRLRAAFTGACALLALSGCLAGSSDPPPQSYSLRATVSGLDSPGLMLAVNGWPLRVTADTTSQLLAATLPSGAGYAVTVTGQPAGETCTAAQGQGVIRGANVANVVITCSDQAYPLGGTMSGLNGAGLVLANGSDTRAVSAGASTFTMPTPVAYTSSYNVTIQTQPAGEACAVRNGTGSMPVGGVSTVAVSCTDQPFSLGGSISGLGNNSGLVLTNGGDTLPVAAGSTSFTMPTRVAFGSPYSVAVQTAPTGLTCTASNASGTMPAGNLASVVIACADKSYTVGGSLSGLTSSGLVLANGSDTLSVGSGASSFTMPTAVAYTSAYAVTVQQQPTGLTCSVSNGTNTMGSSAVTNVAVTCSANTYTVGGTITGLSASGLTLLNNGGDATTISANATQFTMNTGVAYRGAYAITVQTPPAGLVCSVNNGTGPVGAGDVTSVSIDCVSNFTLMYSFAGGSDGASPYHTLIQGSDGNFYGSTLYGGTNNGGTVFEITPSGAESVFYTFPPNFLYNAFFEAPFGALVQATDGNFYGTTAFTGANSSGAFFQLTPSAAETDLYSFPMGASDPFCGVIQGRDGNFYGTTGALGWSDDGTVFEMTPSGTETVLHVFAQSGSDGEYPYAGLIQGSDGNLYGTTYQGGANGLGTVWEVTPAGSETILYSFAGGSDAANPYATVIQGSDGNFYGTTYNGGSNGLGTVFRLTPSGTETVLYSFAGGNDGANPEAGLTQGSDGNLYGATYAGGASGVGTIFEVTLSGAETVLHAFVGSDGANPQVNLVQGSDGNLYGSTAGGGASGNGAFFKITLQ